MASYRLPKNLRLNDAALNKTVENLMSKTVTKYKTAGDKANRELRRKYTIEWFRQAGFPSSFLSMVDALDYRSSVKQSSGKIYLHFQSFVNPEKYEIEHTSLWRQRDKYSEIQPFNYIVHNLQWKEGIIGLPAKSSVGTWTNKHFHQTVPLGNYLADIYKEKWDETVKKYL